MPFVVFPQTPGGHRRGEELEVLPVEAGDAVGAGPGREAVRIGQRQPLLPGLGALDGQRPGEGTSIGKMPVGGAMTEIPRYGVFNPMMGFEGDIEYAALYAGESTNLVTELKPAATIVEDLVSEATAALRELT